MFIILLTFIQILTINGDMEEGISYIVQAGRKDCFYRDIDSGVRIDFDLQVLSGGEMDISVEIRSPNGKVLLSEIRETEISKEMTTSENGTHEFCFDNRFSTFSEKIIYFDLGIEDFKQLEESMISKFNLPKDSYENIEQIKRSLETIENHMERLSHMQAIFKSIHKRHFNIQDGNLRKVTWFSFGFSVLMILVGIIQVVSIRSLFAVKDGNTFPGL